MGEFSFTTYVKKVFFFFFSDLWQKLRMQDIEQRFFSTLFGIHYVFLFASHDDAMLLFGGFFFRREMTQPQSTWRWSHPLSNPVPYCRADCLKLSFFSRTIVDWNSLPSETAMAKTPASFQSRLSTSPTLTVQVFLFPLPLLFFGNALRSLTKCQSSNCWILWILRK